MNSNEIKLLVVTGLILLAVISFIVIRNLRKRIKFNEALKNQIPEEIEKDFLKAEVMMQESNGELTPQQILLKLWKDKKNIKNLPNIKPKINNEFPMDKIEEKPKGLNLKGLFKK